MEDAKIGSSIPSNIQTTETDSVETPPEVNSPPEVSIAEDPLVSANTTEAMNRSATETKGFMDISGEYLKRSLDGEVNSPLARDLGSEPDSAGQFGNANQEFLH